MEEFVFIYENFEEEFGKNGRVVWEDELIGNNYSFTMNRKNPLTTATTNNMYTSEPYT